MESSSLIRSALMGIFSAIILGSFIVLLLLALLRWCLCNLCGATVIRRNVVLEPRRTGLRIGIYDRRGLASGIDQQLQNPSYNIRDKSGLPTYEEAMREMSKPRAEQKSQEIIIDPGKL